MKRGSFASLVVVLSISAAASLVLTAGAAGTLDQEQPFGGARYWIGGHQAWAQVYTAGLTGLQDQVDIYVGRDGNDPPTGPLVIEIREVIDGAPGSVVLGREEVAAADVPSEFLTWLSVPFNPAVPVSAGTQYALVLLAPDPAYGTGINVTDHPSYMCATSDGGASWECPVTGDLAFRTYVSDPTLSVVLAGDGAGSVTSDPAGIDCPADDCAAGFLEGTLVTLTATADGGSAFAGWSGDDACGDGDGPLELTIAGDVSCTATFEALPTLSVVLAGDGAGSVTSDPAGIDCPDGDCAAGFLEGTLVTLTATPDGDDLFLGWSGDGCEGGVVTITGGITCTATFAPPLAIVTETLSAGVWGTPYGATLVATGGEPPYAWSIVAGTLPPGLNLAANGVITGTPTTAGTFSFTAQVTDAGDRTAQRAFSIGVQVQLIPADPTPPPAVEDDVPAADPACTITPAPAPFGVSIGVATGCTIDELPAATSIWVTVNGLLVGYIPGAPAWVNAAFVSHFPGGVVPDGTPMLIVRR